MARPHKSGGVARTGRGNGFVPGRSCGEGFAFRANARTTRGDDDRVEKTSEAMKGRRARFLTPAATRSRQASLRRRRRALRVHSAARRAAKAATRSAKVPRPAERSGMCSSGARWVQTDPFFRAHSPAVVTRGRAQTGFQRRRRSGTPCNPRSPSRTRALAPWRRRAPARGCLAGRRR